MGHDLHTPNRPGSCFCECGKVVDPDGLKRTAINGFSGGQSMSPRVEKFWQTGEPEVLKRSWPLDKPVQEMPVRDPNLRGAKDYGL